MSTGLAWGADGLSAAFHGGRLRRPLPVPYSGAPHGYRLCCAQRVPDCSPGRGTGHRPPRSLVFPGSRGPRKEGPGSPGASTRQAARSSAMLPAWTPRSSSLARTLVPEPPCGEQVRMLTGAVRGGRPQGPGNHRCSPGTRGPVPPAASTQSDKLPVPTEGPVSEKAISHLQGCTVVRHTLGRQIPWGPQRVAPPTPVPPATPRDLGRPALGELRSHSAASTPREALARNLLRA